MKPSMLGRIGQVGRWLKSRLMPGGVILLYHRVTESPSDPQLLCVTPQHLDEHLEILRKDFFPTRLQHLTRSLRERNLPQGTVVVTFDDGYADNLYTARPLLERYDISATVFVTTEYIGSEREFWWDELERILLQPCSLPETLRLSVNGSAFHCELGEAARYNEDAYRRHRCWNVEVKDTPSPRHSLYRSLCQLLRALPRSKQVEVLDFLLAWAGVESKGRPSHRALSWAEIFRLVEGGLVEVGSHTVTHPILSLLPPDAQWAEIQGSKVQLEKILERPVISFAYPYGLQRDYSAKTVTMVREAGFELACSAFPEMVWRDADRFQLPRILVRDWDGDEFARQLKGWING